jgi:hypothetical protein
MCRGDNEAIHGGAANCGGILHARSTLRFTLMARCLLPRSSQSIMAVASEPRRLCNRCGGIVEVMIVTVRTAGGRQLPAKIGACVRCAQWYNEAGLGELPTSSGSPND